MELKKVLSSSILQDEAMFDVYHAMSLEILQVVIEKNRQVVIGITGPPGAGKSTVAQSIANIIPDSIVVPMDGYHYTKAKLNTFDDPKEAFRRRGAHWTFDGEKFVHDLEQLKSHRSGKFPSFDHGVGDPVEEDITVTTHHKVVLVEGNYLLLDIEPWKQIKGILDFTYFINCDESILRDRVIKRHMKTGRSEEEAIERVETNDILNAREIQLAISRADKVIQSV